MNTDPPGTAWRYLFILGISLPFYQSYPATGTQETRERKQTIQVTQRASSSSWPFRKQDVDGRPGPSWNQGTGAWFLTVSQKSKNRCLGSHPQRTVQSCTQSKSASHHIEGLLWEEGGEWEEGTRRERGGRSTSAANTHRALARAEPHPRPCPCVHAPYNASTVPFCWWEGWGTNRGVRAHCKAGV